ncbi:MAG: DUF1553 domain-containing protein [Planctomycetota bacterium]
MKNSRSSTKSFFRGDRRRTPKSSRGQISSGENDGGGRRDDLWRWTLDAPIPYPTIAETEKAEAALNPQEKERLGEIDKTRKTIENEFPSASYALATREGKALDLRVQVGGNPANLSDTAVRGAPASLLFDGPLVIETGSGRRELAEWMASPKNPLTPRVIVNRIWQHHFGRGLVGTPDNFGAMGERPSHPELLDYLAAKFIENGWSIKSMHRLLMLSSAYQRSSQRNDASALKDPRNILLTSMPVRRLEAECVRDAMLQVAGNLDSTRFGPSVPMHITPFMVEGRDLPSRSGPLDGAGRRSIYLEVRRNHREPIFSAFDFPKPDAPAGSRDVSLVPGQALVLLNDAFVAHEAEVWARKVLRSSTSNTDRLREMYVTALARPPRDKELQAVEAFLAAQEQRYLALDMERSNAKRRAWADICQVLFNHVEFLFVY